MKKNYWIGFFLVYLTMTGALSAKIVEIHHFKEIVNYVDKETLTAFDIDDTLIKTETYLGDDLWFQSILKEFLKTLPAKEALDKSLELWEGVRKFVKVELVEADTVHIIKKLQDQQFHCIGLTTQGYGMAARTINQLLNLGIDLSYSIPISKETLFHVNKYLILFCNGILFTSGTNKGETLFELANVLDFNIKKIVFINDKESHLKEIEDFIKEKGLNVEFIGLRYGGRDARKAGFKLEIAEYQLQHSRFTKIISDEEAKQALGL